MDRQEKIETIHVYEEALKTLDATHKRISLEQLDYKIIYHFHKKNSTTVVHFLVTIRGFIVKLLKKRG